MGYRDKDAESILVARKSEKTCLYCWGFAHPFFTNLLMDFTDQIAEKRNYLLSIYAPLMYRKQA